MEFGERLKQTRQQQHLTQATVADALHVSRQTISSWETGNSYPDIDSLLQLSDFYQLSLDTLLKEDHGMTATLRKSDVLAAMQSPMTNLTIINFVSITVLMFADQLHSVTGIFLLVALLNALALNKMAVFTNSLTQEGPYTRWLKRRPWMILFAVLATIGAIWTWTTHQSGWAAAFTLFAAGCWWTIFYAEVGHFKSPVISRS